MISKNSNIGYRTFCGSCINYKIEDSEEPCCSCIHEVNGYIGFVEFKRKINNIELKQIPTGLPLKNGIELKNINLNGLTLEDEIKKFEEEYKEFMNVITGKDNDTSFFHAVEEMFDMVQAALGVIFLKYKKKASAVMRLYQYHELKIMNRPRKNNMR